MRSIAAEVIRVIMERVFTLAWAAEIGLTGSKYVGSVVRLMFLRILGWTSL